MTYTPKIWVDFPAKTTPINAAALKALEQRVAAFCAAEAVWPGVGGYEDFRAKQRVAGANMSVDVGLPSVLMQVWIRESTGTTDRYEYNGVQLNAAIATADGTNPRIDRVCIISPASIDSVTAPQLVVLTGTPTAGATNDNLSGAQAVPAGYQLLADVVVGAGVATIVTANIRDRRTIGGGLGTGGGVMPWLLTGRDEVSIDPDDALVLGSVTLTPTTHDTMQGAYIATLPRRIVGATRLRWKYAQGATNATTNYNIAICDMSGRLIVATGATAFSGAANAIVEASLTITATTFEAGNYFVWMGVAALTAASAVSFHGVQANISVTAPGAPFRNHKLQLGSGGTTFPATNTLLGYTDVAGVVAAANELPVPMVALSVG